MDCSCVVYRAEVRFVLPPRHFHFPFLPKTNKDSCAKSHCTGIADPTTGLAKQCGTGGDSKPAPATSSKAGKAAAGSTSSPAPTSSSSSVSSAGGKDEIKTATTSDAIAGAVTGTSTSSSAASTGTETPNFAGKTGVEMGLVGLGIGLGFFVGL